MAERLCSIEDYEEAERAFAAPWGLEVPKRDSVEDGLYFRHLTEKERPFHRDNEAGGYYEAAFMVDGEFVLASLGRAKSIEEARQQREAEISCFISNFRARAGSSVVTCTICGISAKYYKFGPAILFHTDRNRGPFAITVCNSCAVGFEEGAVRNLSGAEFRAQVAEGRAARAERDLEKYKEQRRKSDERRKEARKKHDEAKRNQPKPIGYFVDQSDWGKLRVIFSEDSVGLGLIALISHPTTPEAERDNAITKLKGRRIKWQQQRTTSAETQNTRRETKSALSLASSRGE